jgi:hypothetical protein
MTPTTPTPCATTHGHQQMALFNAFYDESCYLPIHIYEGRSGKLITTVLPPGRRPSGKEIVAILKRVVRRIRQAWPEVGILLRADSHYAAPEVFTFCRTENLKYMMGLTPNPVLRRNAAVAPSSGNALGAGAVRYDPAAGSQDRGSGSATSDAGQDASADLVSVAGGVEKSVRVLPGVAIKPARR